MLKQRVITGVIAALSLIAAIYALPGGWLAALLGVVVVLGAHEWARLAGLQVSWHKLVYAALFIPAMYIGVSTVGLYSGAAQLDVLRNLLVVACSFWALALLWAVSYPGSALIWGSVPVRLLMGALVLLPAWLSLAWLRELEHGRWLLVYVIVLVCVNDIAAYFAGRAWGRGKLLPKVSPGKTWAGFYGGLAGGVAAAAAVGVYVGLESSWLMPWIVVGAIAVLAGILGDLIESMVKRHRGVKDSGTLLPGHGGVLDRIDSITAAAPVFALGLIAAGLQA